MDLLLRAAMGSDWAGNIGSVAVAELDWAVPEHARAAGGPFDVVLAADCVYHEEIVEDLLRTVLAITDHRSTGKQLSFPAACWSYRVGSCLLLRAAIEFIGLSTPFLECQGRFSGTLDTPQQGLLLMCLCCAQ